MKLQAICLAALVAISLGAGAQTMYRWVDKDGRVHYSDQPPPKDARKAEQRRLDTSTIETSNLPYATRQAAADHPVTLYTASNCTADCQIAREFLARRGVPYSEKVLGTPADAAAFKQSFGTDQPFVPSVTVGSQKRQGFAEGAWNDLLDSARYPRTAAPGSAPKPAPAPAQTPAPAPALAPQ